MNKLINIFIKLSLLLCYPFSFFSSRKKSVWIFSSGHHFRDNPKYLFLYVINNQPEITAVWISRNRELVNELKAKGYLAEYYMSLRGIRYILRAKLCITEAGIATVNLWFSGGMKNINLWHGIPLKKVGIGNKHYFFPKERTVRNIKKWLWVRAVWLFERNPDFLLVTSEYYRDVMRQAFAARDENIFITGQPRNDVLFSSITGAVSDDIEEQLQLVNSDTSDKHILCMPTFRDSALSWIEGSGLDFDKLNIKLQQINTTLWLKLHPLDVSNSIKPLAFSNIKILSGNIDMYPLLKSFDALVTDYSSIYFDYLLLNRPTIFFAYDLENYLSVDRDMYFEYDDMTPGPIVKTQSELEQEIISIAKSKDEYASERQKIRNRVYDYRGGEASEHIFRELESRYLH